MQPKITFETQTHPNSVEGIERAAQSYFSELLTLDEEGLRQHFGEILDGSWTEVQGEIALNDGKFLLINDVFTYAKLEIDFPGNLHAQSPRLSTYKNSTRGLMRSWQARHKEDRDAYINGIIGIIKGVKGEEDAKEGAEEYVKEMFKTIVRTTEEEKGD